ncbi:hypothetical protein CLU79DRAFT_747040 [Phycomyces nitens]|nr:hypothetical protein CLU79DRAFT_747040 [Phycomyces nitens]
MATIVRTTQAFQSLHSNPPKLDAQPDITNHIAQHAPARKSVFAIAQTVLLLFDGRDKALKTIQYTFKVLIYYNILHSKVWSTMTSRLSLTRRILRLGTALGPIRVLMATLVPPTQNLLLLNTITNNLADDVVCFYKLSLINPGLGKQAQKTAHYCWFISIIADLKSAFSALWQLQLLSYDHERLNQSQRDDLWMARISIIKLMADGVFCACDIWKPSFSGPAQAWSGLISSVLAGYKLWHKSST